MTEVIAAPVSARPRNGFLVGAFMFAHFTHHVSNSLLAPLQPLIRDSLGLGYVQSGWLVSAFSLSLGLSQAPIGVIADRVAALGISQAKASVLLTYSPFRAYLKTETPLRHRLQLDKRQKR